MGDMYPNEGDNNQNSTGRQNDQPQPDQSQQSNPYQQGDPNQQSNLYQQGDPNQQSNPYQQGNPNQQGNLDQQNNPYQQANTGQGQPQYQQPQYNGQSQYQQYDPNQYQQADPNQQYQYGQGPYQQNPYQQYSQYQQPRKADNGMAIASLICGIVAVAIACCGWFITLPVSIVGLVLGILSIRRKTGGRTMAIIGIILCSFGILLGILGLISTIALLSDGNGILNNFFDEFYNELDLQDYYY